LWAIPPGKSFIIGGAKMGRAKRSRKIRSGNKMVRIALRKQAALHAIQIITTIAMCRSTIGVIQAQRMKKDGAPAGEVLRICQDEIVLPLTDLAKKLAPQNTFEMGGTYPQQLKGNMPAELLEKLRVLSAGTSPV
jgi:hypothetical protein